VLPGIDRRLVYNVDWVLLGSSLLLDSWRGDDLLLDTQRKVEDTSFAAGFIAVGLGAWWWLRS